MANIIVPRLQSFGRTRYEQAKNLQREGWGTGLTPEQMDKCKYLEKKRGKRWYRQIDIDHVRSS